MRYISTRGHAAPQLAFSEKYHAVDVLPEHSGFFIALCTQRHLNAGVERARDIDHATQGE